MKRNDVANRIPAEGSAAVETLRELFDTDFVYQSPALFEEHYSRQESWIHLQEAMSSRRPVAHRQKDLRILLAVPIVTRGSISGIASALLTSSSPEWLSERLATTARLLCEDRSELDQRDEHIRLFTEQLSASLEEVTWLLSLSENLDHCTANNRLEDLAARSFPALRDVLRAEVVALVRRNDSTTSSGWPCDEFEFPVWEGPEVLTRQQCAEFVATIAGGSRVQPFLWNFDSHLFGCGRPKSPDDIHSCILVEVRNGSHHYGWILVLNKIAPSSEAEGGGPRDLKTLGLNEFGTVEATLVRSAARMLAAHATNVRMFREQRDFTLGVIRSMINVVDLRDKYTRGHSDRVALMGRSLAAHLGLLPNEQQQIHLSGLLHDVGKIGIPDAVLLKPGRLSDEEFAIIRQHPEQGVEILKHIRQLESILPGVLHHHESWDGSGYPHGLRGDAIPLMARVLAVVDAFDAITTCRPYRHARTIEEAAAILRNGCGQQWDPDIVNVFLENIDAVTADCREWESQVADVVDTIRTDFDELDFALEGNGVYRAIVPFSN